MAIKMELSEYGLSTDIPEDLLDLMAAPEHPNSKRHREQKELANKLINETGRTPREVGEQLRRKRLRQSLRKEGLTSMQVDHQMKLDDMQREFKGLPDLNNFCGKDRNEFKGANPIHIIKQMNIKIEEMKKRRKQREGQLNNMTTPLSSRTTKNQESKARAFLKKHLYILRQLKESGGFSGSQLILPRKPKVTTRATVRASHEAHHQPAPKVGTDAGGKTSQQMGPGPSKKQKNKKKNDKKKQQKIKRWNSWVAKQKLKRQQLA